MAGDSLFAGIQNINPDIHSRTTTLRLTNTLGAVAVASIIGALVCLSSPAIFGDDAKLPSAVQQYQLILYSVSGPLVVAVFEIHPLYSWVASVSKRAQDADSAQIMLNFLVKPPRDEYMSLANNLALGAGMVFSTLFLRIFAPVALCLSKRTNALLRAEAVKAQCAIFS